MANLLDEVTGPVNTAGRDVNVINKQIPVTVGVGSTIFEICLWVIPIIIAILIPLLFEASWAIVFTGIVPGLIWLYTKVEAENYFQQLEQKLQADASTIDNYIVDNTVDNNIIDNTTNNNIENNITNENINNSVVDNSTVDKSI